MNLLKEFYSIIIAEKLYLKTGEELELYLKKKPDLQEFIHKIKKEYKLYCSFKDVISKTYDLLRYDYSSIEKLKVLIKEQLTTSKQAVSNSKISFFIARNTDFKNHVLEVTKDFPSEINIASRCTYILKDILNFPRCKHCKEKYVCYANTNFLGSYCSLSCAGYSESIKNDKRKRCLEKHGVTHSSQRKDVKAKVRKTQYEKFGCFSFRTDKQKETNIKKYGVDNVWKSKEVRKQIKQTMQDKYQVDNYTEVINKSPELRQRAKDTLMKNLGVEHSFQSQKVLDKRKETWLKKYGVENVSQDKATREKAKKTNIEKYGVGFYSQTEEFWEKYLNTSFRIKYFENTNIYYIGMYEKYFLNKIKELDLLNYVQNHKKGLKYVFKEKNKVYFPDFIFNNYIIEIKSTWTYNRNGTDLELQAKNEAKWEKAKEIYGDKFIVLMEKKEIDQFIESLKT